MALYCIPWNYNVFKHLQETSQFHKVKKCFYTCGFNTMRWHCAYILETTLFFIHTPSNIFFFLEVFYLVWLRLLKAICWSPHNNTVPKPLVKEHLPFMSIWCFFLIMCRSIRKRHMLIYLKLHDLNRPSSNVSFSQRLSVFKLMCIPSKETLWNYIVFKLSLK